MGISKADLYDADVYDAAELNTDSTVVYLTLTVTSTVAPHTVNVALASDGEGILTSKDHPVAGAATQGFGDKVDITGTSGGTGNGTFTANVIVSDLQFTVVETIGTSTGGSANFRYPSGASNIGFDPTKQNITPKNIEQTAITDISNHELLDNEPVGTGITYSNTRVGSTVTQEKWVTTVGAIRIKQIDYTYTGSKVTQEVRKVYDAATGNTIIAQATFTYSYTGSTVTGETVVRNV